MLKNTLEGDVPLRKAGELDSIYQSIYCIPNLYTSLMQIDDEILEMGAKTSLTDLLTEVAKTLLAQKELNFAWVGVPLFTSLRNLMVDENFVTDENGFLSVRDDAPVLLHRWLDYGGIKLATLKMLADAEAPHASHNKIKELLLHFERRFFQGVGGQGMYIKLLSYGAVRLNSNYKYTPVSAIAHVVHAHAKANTGGKKNG